jgi:hypothetical protein
MIFPRDLASLLLLASPAVVGVPCCCWHPPLFQLFLVLLWFLLLMCSYRCCFVPGGPTVAEVTGVAAFPSNVVVFSAMVFPHIPGGPCCYWHPCCFWLPFGFGLLAIIGFPAVTGVPAVAGDPVVAVHCSSRSFKKSNILKLSDYCYQTVIFFC